MALFLLGLFWILAVGITQGAFTLPMKFVRRWKWEHLWLIYSVAAFFILPYLVVLRTVPRLGAVFAHCDAGVLWRTALFGAGWGAGSVFFGLGVDALGMALGFSMMTGIYTALGALIPLAVQTPDLLWRRSGTLIMTGNAVMTVGMVLQAIGGERRDKLAGAGVPAGLLGEKISFGKNLVICLASGVLSCMLNFSYAFGKPIADTAQQLGATKDGAVNAVWLVALPAGGLLNVLYCLHLMRCNSTWPMLYRKTAPADWVHAWVMAILWTGSVILYGWGANDLGRLGPSLGWSLWNAILIITTVICGLLTHEWRGVRGRPFTLLLAGTAVLILSTVILGLGGAGA